MDNLSDLDNAKAVKKAKPIVVKYKRKNGSTGVKIDCSRDGRTKASFQHESDINNIIAKFQKTGLLDNARDYGVYADLTTATDYQDYMNKVLDAQEMFEKLPARVRQDFNHDPAAFLDFVHNEENKDKMREYGLLKKEVVTNTNVNVIPDTEIGDGSEESA